MIGQTRIPWRDRVKRTMPVVTHAVRLARLLRNQIRYPVAATVLDLHGRILGGPFAGVRFARSGIANYPQILGSYEQCLVPLVERIVRDPPPTIIDVGAAYGYYALGFAQRCPDTRVIAYEMDPTRAALLHKYRRRNGFDGRVDARAIQCSTRDLAQDLRSATRSLIFMDVEGAEDALLVPDEVPRLCQAEIIVELHEIFVPGVTARIRQRFADSHHQTLLEEQPPDRAAIPAWADRLVRPYWRRMTFEDRPSRNTWLHLVPNTVAAAQ